MAQWRKFPNVTRARLKGIKGVVAEKLFFACTENDVISFSKTARYNASDVH